jgi:hypothetical protein
MSSNAYDDEARARGFRCAAIRIVDYEHEHGCEDLEALTIVVLVFTPKGFRRAAQGCDALRGATLGSSHTLPGNNPNGVAALLLEVLTYSRCELWSCLHERS